MKKLVLIVGVLLISQFFEMATAEAQASKKKQAVQKKVSTKAKVVAPVKAQVVVKPATPVKPVAPPPSAQAAAASMPVKSQAPVVLPPMGDYKYEVNIAPLALLANWYTIDLLKYDSSNPNDLQREQFGYGVTLISFVRNNNDVDGTFPSRAGYGVGATAVWDHRDFYYATHAYYEKFERYRNEGTLVQEREGFRVNAVVGVKEIIKRRFALKFGWGVEAQTYKVREFSELNRFVQTNYQTNILNPFFLECKLSMYF